MLCYSYAHAGVLDRNLITVVCRRLMEVSPRWVRFESRAAVRMFWTFAKLRCSHLPFIKWALPQLRNYIEGTDRPISTLELCCNRVKRWSWGGSMSPARSWASPV